MMNSRLGGLSLLVLGIATFAGTTQQLIPAIAFFPGMIVCVLGTFVFMKANRLAMQESEERTLQRLNPQIKTPASDDLADRQATSNAAAGSDAELSEGRVTAQAAHAEQVQPDELVLYEVDGSQPEGLELEAVVTGEIEEDSTDPGFVVTQDVSFPLEIQQQGALADQLQKLKRLADDGIISDEEFAVAKAKLLA